MPLTLKPGAVVAIAPSFAEVNPSFVGCLLVVESVRAWGVTGVVIAPGAERSAPPRQYPLRVKWADVIATGGNVPPLEDPTAGDGHNPGPAICCCDSPAAPSGPAGDKAGRCGYCGGAVLANRRQS